MNRPRTVRATVSRRRPKRHGPAPGSEEELHRAVADFLRHALRPHECLWFHVPNGGWRSDAEGGVLKALGVMAGIPDLLFVRPGAKLAAIELKSAAGKTTCTQKAVALALGRLGVPVRVCRSIDDVELALSIFNIPNHAHSRVRP